MTKVYNETQLSSSVEVEALLQRERIAVVAMQPDGSITIQMIVTSPTITDEATLERCASIVRCLSLTRIALSDAWSKLTKLKPDGNFSVRPTAPVS